MDTKDLYNQVYEDVLSKDLNELCAEEIDLLWSRLLKCIPNDGKLYKFRTIEGQAFEYAYDGLKQGYMYFSAANALNDDLDCALNFDPIKEVDLSEQEFIEHPWIYLYHWLKHNPDIKWNSPMDEYCIKHIVSCIDLRTGKFYKDKAIEELLKCGMTCQQAEKVLQHIFDWTEAIINQRAEELKKPISSLVKFNQNNRQDIYVYSMSEVLDSNSMWGRYANGSNGFCIEYDFNLVNNYPSEIKRIFCQLYKVSYQNELKPFSFLNMQRYFISDRSDKNLFITIKKELISSFITKTLEWADEREWRIMLFNLDAHNKLPFDIVSGLTIDERAIYADNAQKLIQLAKEKCWNIKIRKMNITGTKHIYGDYLL